ncbi:hypothetical protein [Chondromyces apiculatus]|uniref:Uncharacterized protein n=1 Tax=Chondromyces apiculatus DSM 436 TaxID=1192034 RepID=A0A017T9W3_9BACT|nr:hypothetical protein [Chondromyces apiculatus]EYF06038.1 Hypothetical protein CAP_2228 [Chondromyces apiculatus DSM 436]
MSLALDRASRALERRGAALVCDIDGTLASDVARRHLRPRSNTSCLAGIGQEQIEQYMDPALVALDEPIPGASGLLASLLASPGEPRLLMVTARWNTLWGTTSRWLERHYPSFRPFLLMRRRSDLRPSVDVKLDMIRTYGGCDRGGVWIDDDPRMLLAAERAGFVALKAPDIFPAAANINGITESFGHTWRRPEGEFLRCRSSQARLLSPTAPRRIPTGAVLCLCGPEDECVLCHDQMQEPA